MAMTAEETRANNGASQLDLTRQVGGIESDLTERIYALEVAHAT